MREKERYSERECLRQLGRERERENLVFEDVSFG